MVADVGAALGPIDIYCSMPLSAPAAALATTRRGSAAGGSTASPISMRPGR